MLVTREQWGSDVGVPGCRIEREEQPIEQSMNVGAQEEPATVLVNGALSECIEVRGIEHGIGLAPATARGTRATMTGSERSRPSRRWDR